MSVSRHTAAPRRHLEVPGKHTEAPRDLPAGAKGDAGGTQGYEAPRDRPGSIRYQGGTKARITAACAQNKAMPICGRTQEHLEVTPGTYLIPLEHYSVNTVREI